MLPLFGSTLFVSAFLLFCLQPMVGKMLLPMLGGTPAVWAACVVFFQSVYLAGGAFVFVVTRKFGPRGQMTAFAAALIAACVALPLAHLGLLPNLPPGENSPIGWLALVLLTRVGLPCFALSLTSSFLQSWFSLTGHRRSNDPYFLYMASNAGSLLALVCYPGLIEPGLRVLEQTRVWTAGYGVLTVLALACMAVARKSARPGPMETVEGDRSSAPGWPQTARWTLLALVPSSLMLAVTNYLSELIAPVPMLWVVPLGLYLLTMILAFSSKAAECHRWAGSALAIVSLPWVVSVVTETRTPAWGLIPLHLFAFFCAALVCHCALSRSRPTSRHLAGYYLWVALGGALGGFFNLAIQMSGLVRLIDYPLGFALACCFREPGGAPSGRGRRKQLALQVSVCAGVLVLFFASTRVFDYAAPPHLIAALSIPMLAALFLWRKPRAFGAAVFAVLVVGAVFYPTDGQLVYVERNFFGIVRVRSSPDRKIHSLVVNSTLQGLQIHEAGVPNRAIANYAPESPIGQLMDELGKRESRRVAVIGLGAGGMASYARPGDEWEFYELNPSVYRAANNPEFFTFLRDHRAKAMKVTLGDARIRIAAAPDAHYDLIVMDAFTGSGMPVHLTTREAFSLYRKKLAPGGLIVFNVAGNPLFDVHRILCTLAQDSGQGCFGRFEEEHQPGTPAERGMLNWIVIAPDKAALGNLFADPRWQDVIPSRYGPVWTDDYSSLARILLLPKFRRLKQLMN